MVPCNHNLQIPFIESKRTIDASAGKDDSGWHMQDVYHTYDYFDFKPSIPDTVAFQPALMLPGGDGCTLIQSLNCASDRVRSEELKLLSAMTTSHAFAAQQSGRFGSTTCSLGNPVESRKNAAIVAGTGVAQGTELPDAANGDSAMLPVCVAHSCAMPSCAMPWTLKSYHNPSLSFAAMCSCHFILGHYGSNSQWRCILGKACIGSCSNSHKHSRRASQQPG